MGFSATPQTAAPRCESPVLKFDGVTYEEILERELNVDRSITQVDSQVGNMLDKVSLELKRLKSRFQVASKPSQKPAEEAAPDSEVLPETRLLEELQSKVDRDKQQLQRRDNALMKELDGKLGNLRDLEGRLLKRQQRQERQATVQAPGGLTREQQVPFLQWIPDEQIVDFAVGSFLPVSVFLAASLLVAWLSQQFLRVATAWRRSRWSKAERLRKVQLRRLGRLRDLFFHGFEELGAGRLDKASDSAQELFAAVGRWADEATWEEVLRLEAASFWERFGPDAFALQAVIPAEKPPKGYEDKAQWVAERWVVSAQGVVKDTLEAALTAWAAAEEEVQTKPAPVKKALAAAAEGAAEVAEGAAKAAEGAAKAAEGAAEEVAEGAAKAAKAVVSPAKRQASGLVIRIFGRWPKPKPRIFRRWQQPSEEWVSIVDIPLGGWREKSLRLLIPAEKDVRDLPVLGFVCERTLTAIVETQVRRVLNNNEWGGLTSSLWTGHDEKPFQIGYEVVEVESNVPDEMRAIARELPRSGTPGRVVPVRAELETQITETL